MKQEFEMLQSEMDEILRINKEVSNMPLVMIGSFSTSGQEKTEAINAYWKTLGEKYGFKWDSVEGSSKGALFFIATSQPTKIEKELMEISMREAEIDEALERIEILKTEIKDLKAQY